jgi:hypothetical protein
LKKNINDFTILINCPPQVMLFSLDLNEDFVYKESIAETPMLLSQSPGVMWAKFVVP